MLVPDCTTLVVSLQERVDQLEQRMEEIARENAQLRHAIQVKWLKDELRWRALWAPFVFVEVTHA